MEQLYVAIPSTCVDVLWRVDDAIGVLGGHQSTKHGRLRVLALSYFCINLAMIGAGALLVRRVFVIFGALGCCLYLGHLASTVFEDSWLFPVALSAIGLGVVYSGIWWQKNEARIAKSAQAILPKALQELLANKAR